MEHDYRSQINSLLRKVEQLEGTITEERFSRKIENEQKDERIRILQEMVSIDILIVKLIENESKHFKEQYLVFRVCYSNSIVKKVH